MSPGLKGMGGLPSFRFAAARVQPSELDQRFYYHVLKPSTSASFIGTVEAAAAGDFVLDQTKVDYPRTLLLTLLGEAAGMGGTATIYGTDQFGGSINESVGLASAAGGGTSAGTKIFDTIASATLDGLDGDGGTAIGTASLGFASGTGAGIVAQFGLPVRIGAVSDVKRIIWNDAATIKGVNGGTVTSTYVDTAMHSFNIGQIVAAADDFYVEIITTYDSTGDVNVA